MNNSVVENIRFWYHGNEYPINEWRVSFDDKLKFLNIGVRTFEGPYDAEINGIVYLLKNNDYPENFPEFDHVVTWISTAMLSIGHQERRIYNIPCVGDDYKGSITAYRR
jgi:hypothetical protein